MKARDVMTTNVITVEPNTDVRDIARRLVENRISAVPVVDRDGRIVGIVSEGDLMRRAESETERQPSWWLSLLLLPEQKAINYVKTHGRRAGDVMTRRVISVGDDASLEHIAEILERHRIKRVPVVHGDKLVGIVSRSNLLHGLVARQTGTPASVDDLAIRAAVEKTLSDIGVDCRFLNIVVSGGVVHMWGSVVTPEEKEAVRVAAENAPGVTGVRDNVNALPQQVRNVMWAE